MAQAPTPESVSRPVSYGSWLADQQWHFAEDRELAWVLTDDDRYLVESVYQDSEERLVPTTEMKESLRLMQQAPALLRAVLQSLTLLDNSTLSDEGKAEHVLRVLSAVAAHCLAGQGSPLEVARAVETRLSEER